MEPDDTVIVKLVNRPSPTEFCVDVGKLAFQGLQDSNDWRDRYDVSPMEMSDPKITGSLIIAYLTSDVELVNIRGVQFSKILCIDKRTRSPVFVFVEHSLGNPGQIFKDEELFEMMPLPQLDERHGWLRADSCGLVVATRCYSWFPEGYSR
jgi:hypothetical protein